MPATVTPDLRFEVSRRVKEEFDNGKHYYALHGQQIAAPSHLDTSAIPGLWGAWGDRWAFERRDFG
jgi:hypothetical protein